MSNNFTAVLNSSIALVIYTRALGIVDDVTSSEYQPMQFSLSISGRPHMSSLTIGSTYIRFRTRTPTPHVTEQPDQSFQGATAHLPPIHTHNRCNLGVMVDQRLQTIDSETSGSNLGRVAQDTHSLCKPSILPSR